VDEEGVRRDCWMEEWRDGGMEGGGMEGGGADGDVGGQGDWRAKRRKLNEMSSSYKVHVNIS
jgi:hypothetical protein